MCLCKVCLARLEALRLDWSACNLDAQMKRLATLILLRPWKMVLAITLQLSTIVRGIV